MDSVKPSRIGTVEKAGFMILRMEPTGEGGETKHRRTNENWTGTGACPYENHAFRNEPVGASDSPSGQTVNALLDADIWTRHRGRGVPEAPRDSPSGQTVNALLDADIWTDIEDEAFCGEAARVR